jgi:hypothetical protein
MEQHFKVAAYLQIAYGALILVIAVLLLIVLTGAGAVSGDRTAMLVTSTVGLVIAVILIVLALPSILAGWGLLKRREWARILTIILSCLHLLSFPIGTIIGGYSIWALLQPDAKSYFV